MRKLLSVTMALSMLILSAGCSQKKAETGLNQSTSESISITQTLYKGEKAEIPDNYFYSKGILNTADGTMFFYADEEDKTYCVIYGEDSKITETREFEAGENQMLSYFNLNSEGNITAIAYEYNVNEENIYEVLGVYFNTYDLTGKLISSNPLGDINGHYGEGFAALNNYSVYGDKMLFSFSDEAVIIDVNGNVLETVPVDNMAIYYFDSEGSIMFINMLGYKKMESLVRIIDNSELTFFPDDKKCKLRIGSGDERFTTMLTMNDGIYGMTKDEKYVKVLDSVGSKVKIDNIHYFLPVSEGKLFIAEDDISFYNVRPDDYVENREKVIVGLSYSNFGSDAEEIAVDFEKVNDNYTVEYRDYNGDSEGLKRDILTDNAPDVYVYNGLSQMRKYVNLGAFADIDSLSEKYGGVNSDYFLSNVADAMKYNGKLYTMSEYFSPKFDFARRDVISREYSNWTLDEFYSFAENMPEGMYLGEYYMFHQPEDVFRYLCAFNLSDWADFENGKCDFNNERFIKLLEFCRDAKILEKQPDYFYDEEYIEQRTIEEEINMKRLYNKEALLSSSFFADDLTAIITYMCKGGLTVDECTIINMPNNSGTGQINTGKFYSVLNCGNNEQGGWEFFNYLISFDRMTRYPLWNIPTTKDAFDYCMQYQYDGIRSEDTIKNEINNVKIEIDSNIGQENYDYIINKIKSCSMLVETDDANILYEEFGKFINGEITSAECAERIQSRMEIMLSEQS